MKQVSILILLAAVMAGTTGCDRYKSENKPHEDHKISSRYPYNDYASAKRPNTDKFGLPDTGDDSATDNNDGGEVKTDTPVDTMKSFVSMLASGNTDAANMGFKDKLTKLIIGSTIAFNQTEKTFKNKYSSSEFVDNFTAQAIILPTDYALYTKEGDNQWTAELTLPAGELHKVKFTVARDGDSGPYKITMAYDPELSNDQRSKFTADATIITKAFNAMNDQFEGIKDSQDAINKTRNKIKDFTKEYERNN